MSKTRTEMNYVYNGLGFPIILEEVTFRSIRGEWLLKIDVEKVADAIIKVLPEKPTGLTGSEIRFARTYLKLSKRKLAERLNVSHTAVNKWEQTEEKRAHIDPLVEVALRAFIRLQLQSEDDQDFINFYKGIMGEAKNFSKEVESGPIHLAM